MSSISNSVWGLGSLISRHIAQHTGSRPSRRPHQPNKYNRYNKSNNSSSDNIDLSGGSTERTALSLSSQRTTPHSLRKFNGVYREHLNLAEPLPVKMRRAAPTLPTNVGTAAAVTTSTPTTGGDGQPKKYKLVFLGDQQSGKSSIVRRVIQDDFHRKYMATVGVDLGKLTIDVPEFRRSVRYQIWDTAGQERFRSSIQSYIQDSQAAVIVFDVASRKTFESATRWIEDVRSIRGDQVLIVLVGSKCDCPISEREVGFNELKERAEKEGLMFMETSAMAGYNVQALFQELAVRLIHWNDEQQHQEHHGQNQ